METKLSTKGQVVLPQLIRKSMNLRAGDKLDVGIEGGQIVLVPRKKRAGKGRIIKDPLTGFPVLTVTQQKLRTPYAQHYNLMVQHQLPGKALP